MTRETLVFAVPGDIAARTGGTLYDHKVTHALRAQGWRVDLMAWPSSFPFPTPADRARVAAELAALADGALVMIDGLAFGALPELAEREGRRLRLAALVHHPLALETGLPEADAAILAASERRALACARAVVVTSATTAVILENDFAVPRAKIIVARPGVDPVQAPAPRAPGPPRLFALGSFSPRKAHHVLVDALRQIADLDWTCTIAGNMDRDPETAIKLKRQIAEQELTTRIALPGEVSQAQAAMFYSQADIFVLASLYEGYGMVFSEALAFGLPVVATTGGAIPEVVGPEAGILVAPGDARAFAVALRHLLGDPGKRTALADGARRAGAAMTNWDQTASRIAAGLARV